MTHQDLPRWEIRYRPAGTDEDQTLIIPAESMVSALKQAQQKLRTEIEGAFRIVFISPTPTEEAVS